MTGLRERTRRAVQREIAEAAVALFVERGYEATTIDDVAAAVGMSQRSVFRYFASKEEIILGKLDLVVAEDMLETLRTRPLDEPVWASLRHLLDVLVEHGEKPGWQELTEPIHRVIFGSPALFAGYLQRLHQMQEAVVAVLLQRAETAGKPWAADDPTPRALTAAAFGCLVAAQHSWLASGATGTFAEAVERALATLTPS